MTRLVAVSNRVALPDRRGSAQGGLATGLLAAMRKQGGLWFGWNGKLVERHAEKPEVMEEEGVSFATVPLTGREFERYYVGFANSMLWPLCHSRLNLLRYRDADYRCYLDVNRMFATRLAPLLQEDDLVWVHDYHFLPMGRMLREAGVGQPIGFFLHIPFPFPDTLRTLPDYKNLLRAMLDYDVLGFQTPLDVEAFLAGIRHCCPGAKVRGDYVELEGRHVKVQAFPIGIDVDGVARMARKGRQGNHGQRLEASLTGRRLIIGVDRLDYSKGLPERFRAYGRMLELSPEYRRQVVLLQIAPLSRTEVAEYEDLRQEINAIAGDIHARFAEYDWLPLRYMTRGFPRPTVMGFLSMARIGLVTPMRDGMNLVAKEYCAAQPQDDPGVLVLSSLAGAADQLKDALIVNPYDVDGMAAAIARGLSMPVEERRARHTRLLAALREKDVHRWVADFTDALREAGSVRAHAGGRRAGGSA
ncbi:MAG TPA: trehalose-6-phosphate synthase [Gammaproteobacteria bacterium]